MLLEFSVIFIFLVIAIMLSLVLYAVSYFAVLKITDIEKVSAYECGFDPFEDSRGTFDVRFYLVAILFIIFDLEISFLFPWSLVLGSVDYFGFFVMMLFLFILTVGFLYEWKKGALEW
jgi:NADH:ubiquinone oxidoreductase subunit 3 (subunit A)